MGAKYHFKLLIPSKGVSKKHNKTHSVLGVHHSATTSIADEITPNKKQLVIRIIY